ncbi:phosphopantetheine-binding protein [Sphingomonas oryzagri]
MPSTRDAIIAIIAEEARIDEEKLKPEATLTALGIASLDVVSVLFAIEDKFGVDIPQEEIASTETLGQFIDVILARISAV